MHEYDTSTHNETKTYKQNAIYCFQNYKQNATRQVLRKKEHACRAQRTRSQIADSATTKSEHKNVFFFSSLAHFAEGALRRAKLEN